MQALIAMFLVGTSLISGGMIGAGPNSWFCILIGTLLFIPMIWVHAQILNLYPGRNFSENILLACGRTAGKIICFLYLINAVALGGSILRTFSEFIHIVGMTDTPRIAIAISLVLVLVLILKCQVYVTARIAKFTIPFLYISVVITVVCSINNMEISNLKPVLNCRFPTIAHGVFGFFTTPMGELVLFNPLFQFLNRKEKIFPVFLKGSLLGVFILLVARLRNNLILGMSSSTFTFASYVSVSVISLGEFFTRIEILIGINLLLSGFLKLCVTVFTASDSLIHVFQLKNYLYSVGPSLLLILIFANFITKNFAEYSVWLKIYPFFAFPFQIILPIAILITGKIRKKRGNTPDASPPRKKSGEKRNPSHKSPAPSPLKNASSGNPQKA